MTELANSIEGLWTRICEYIQGMTGKPIVKGKTSFTAQYDCPFFSVWINNIQQVPYDTMQYPDQYEDNDGLTQEIRGLSLIEFEIQGFGSGITSDCRRLAVSFGTDKWNEFEQFNQVGLSEKREIQNISAPLDDSVYEERCSFSFVLYAPISEQFDVDYFNITHVEVQRGEETIYEFEIKANGELNDNH